MKQSSPPRDLKQRTKEFSLRIIRVVESLPNNRTGDVIGRQLLRAGTSVGANYRAARRARSAKEFAAKLGVVEEEADEAVFWLELIVESKLLTSRQLDPLVREGNEIVAMVVASIRTARKSMRLSKPLK